MRWLREAAATGATAVVIAAVAGLSAAGSGAAAPDSGVKGRVVPCGIVLERAAPCATPGARVSVVAGQGQRVERTVKTRIGRRFRMPLEPGDYWLQPRMGKNRGARVDVAVAAGAWVTVTLPAGRVAPPAPRGRG
jgi:hypothetical protein